MNHPWGITGGQLQDALAFGFVALFLALVPLPAIVFRSARLWSREQPQFGSAVLAGAVLVVVVGIVASAALLLALTGWLPPPAMWGQPTG